MTGHLAYQFLLEGEGTILIQRETLRYRGACPGKRIGALLMFAERTESSRQSTKADRFRDVRKYQ